VFGKDGLARRVDAARTPEEVWADVETLFAAENLA
jgi:hypothetical protein